MSEYPNKSCASINRRLMAMLIDYAIVAIIVSPLHDLIAHFLFDDHIVSKGLETYKQQYPGNTFDIFHIMNYMWQLGYLQNYILINMIIVLLIATYSVFFWCYKGGTPGKLLMHCRIVDAKSLDKISLYQAILRVFGYIPSILLFCLGFIVMHFSKQNRALHDYIAGTLVVESKFKLKGRIKPKEWLGRLYKIKG